MGFLGNIANSVASFFGGSGLQIVDTISNTVDKFVHTPEEKAKLKQELNKLREEHLVNEREFMLDMERLLQDREKTVQKTLQDELEVKRGILISELNQGDTYTKRARPTVIYAGLVFILMEMLGLRHLLFQVMKLGPDVIKSSNEIFRFFLASWAGVVGVYTIGRSYEKHGASTPMSRGITGNSKIKSTSETFAKDIISKISLS